MDKKYKFIDLFAGCGGLSEGFLQTEKFTSLAHIEWETPMVKTLRTRLVERWGYSENEAKKRVIKFDVQKTEELIHGNWGKETRNLYEKENHPEIVKSGLVGLIGDETVDLIIGGPPCQAYSIAGRAQDPNGMKNDYRNYLFESFVKIVAFFKPKVFVFENVPGLLSANPGGVPVKNRIFDSFASIGYDIRTPEELKLSIYCAEDFDVPQKRNRVIIFGVRHNSEYRVEDFYQSLSAHRNTSIHKTVRDAIGQLPVWVPTGTVEKKGNSHISHIQVGNTSIDHHVPRYQGIRDQNLFKEWLSCNMNTCSQEEKKKFYTKITGHTSNHIKYRNLEWNEPSPTIVAHLYKDGYMFIHPDVKQLRTITIREAALLQSFPLDYRFPVSNSYAFRMIGNAVPVNFARGIAESVYDVLQKKFIPMSRNSMTDSDVKRASSINILVACEESQAICVNFRELGFNAYSCDLLNCSGGHPEWHFNCDVFEVIKNKGGLLQNGEEIHIKGSWDLMIAHPPCTYLAVSGARWFYHPDDKNLPIEERRPHPRFPDRRKDQADGKAFFLELAKQPIPRIAIENPIGIMNTQWKKPQQVIQPYYFGDEASKATCLWIKKLPLLKHTNDVGSGEWIILKSGKKLPKWYSDALAKAKTPEERRNLRSKTFPGFAKALAEQWGEYLLHPENFRKDEIVDYSKN